MKHLTRLTFPTSVATALFLTLGNAQPAAAQQAPANVLERGRYVAVTMGCNDCHTAGYPMAAGNVPESKWLMGNPEGFTGPWGTTYAVNLRMYMQGLTTDEWVAKAKTLSSRPPMPWFAIRKIDDADLRAFYALVRSLGPVGEAVPPYEPPGKQANVSAAGHP